MLSFLAALIAAPVLVVIAPAEGPVLQAARSSASGVDVVAFDVTLDGACAAVPRCAVGRPTGGDVVVWTERLGDDVVVRAARRADAAVIVEERVTDLAGDGRVVVEAVGRIVGQVPAGIARLQTQAPVAPPPSTTETATTPPPAATPAEAPPAIDQGIPTAWWVLGGAALAVGLIVGSFFVPLPGSPDGNTFGGACAGFCCGCGNDGAGCGACTALSDGCLGTGCFELAFKAAPEPTAAADADRTLAGLAAALLAPAATPPPVPDDRMAW